MCSKRRSDYERSLLAAIVESSSDAIVSLDLDGMITTWNRGAEHLYGWKSDEIIGHPYTTLIPPELHGQDKIIFDQIKRGERLDRFETERCRKDGSTFPVSITVSPIIDEYGAVIGASKIARDISDRQQMLDALIQSEKLAAAGRMAAAISHEVNNPLAAAMNLVYLASRRPMDEEAREYLQGAMDEVVRASQITKQTLSFYREQVSPVLFSPEKLLRDLVRLNQHFAQKKNVEVVSDLRRSGQVFGFANGVYQVFANILRNAVEATPAGGRVVVRLRQHNTHAVITIADNGSGISQEVRQRLYEPFQSTKGVAGNGLGLWVSLGIIKKHHGSISMRSTTRKDRHGTVFQIVLPTAVPTADVLVAA